MSLDRLLCLFVAISLPCSATLIEAAIRGDLLSIQEEIGKLPQDPGQRRKVLEEQDFHGLTALQHVVYHGHIDVVQILITAGADFKRERSDEYYRPIQMAVRRGNTRLIEVLIGAGINPDIQFIGGHGLLDLAVLSGQEESARTLIRLGANPQMLNDAKISPIIRAEQLQHTRMVEILSSGVKQ